MMKWFGKPYGAAYESEGPRVQTPWTSKCRRCGERIGLDDSGVYETGPLRWENPVHYECYMRSIVGGLNHQLGRCTCCGGDQPPDPPDLTRREAAIKAVEAWEKKGRFQVE